MQIHWWEFQISEWRYCMAQGRLLSYCFNSILLTPFHGKLCIGVHHQLWLLSSSRENDPMRLSVARLIVWRHHPWLMATSHPRSENYAHALCHSTANHWLVPVPTGIESLDSFASVTNAQHLQV